MTNARFLFEAIGMIDDEIIEAYASNKQSTKMLTFAQKWGAVAACLLIVAVINVAFAYRFVWDNGSHGGNVTPGDSVTDTTTDALTIEDYVDRCYVRVTNEGLPWDMSVSIYSNGTFQYNPPPISSIIFRPGTWTVEGDVFVLYSEQLGTNYLRMEDGNLVFIEEGSSNFTYANLGDGEVLERGEVDVPLSDIVAHTSHCLCSHINTDTGKTDPKHTITELYSDYFTAGSYNMNFYVENGAFGIRYDMMGKYYGDDKREVLDSVTFLGKTYDVTYSEIVYHSDIKANERSMYDELDSYRTSDGETIYVRADGEVVFLYNSIREHEKLTLSEEEYKNLADEYLKQLRGDKAKSYVVEYQDYSLMYNFYAVNYRYVIDGIRTTDVVKIWLKGDGDIHMFDGADMGRYDGVRMNEELLLAYKKNLKSRIKSFVPTEYVSVSNLTDYLLCQYNGKYYLKATAESNFGGSCEESTSFYIEIAQ